jgi:hypothetical protein
MEASAYRMSLHFSLHRHLLPQHYLFFHCHFPLNHGFAFCCQSAGVGTLLPRYGRMRISVLIACVTVER